MKKFQKRGYAINPQPLNIDADYEKVQMKYYFVNQYAYFSGEIDDHFPEPLRDEFDIHVFVSSNHGHDKGTGILIIGLFLLVGSTSTT